MRLSRKSRALGIILLVALGLAGCGDNGNLHVAEVFSDPAVDADISRDLETDALSAPVLASSTGNILAGVSFVPPSGPTIADTRGFLNFPLAGVPLGAAIDFATVSVYLDDVTLVDPAGNSPFRIELIDTVLYPVPIVSSDYWAVSSGTRFFDFLNTDQGNFVEIEVTSLMREAQALGLPSFQVRIGFDNETYMADLTKTRGSLLIYDGPDTNYAPLLRVEYD